MTTPTLNQWQEDLIWCPSQCYYYFEADGKKWCIYLRWRHSDPWTAELCECDDKWEILEKDRHHESLQLSHNYKSDDFRFLEMECLKITKSRFPNSNITIPDTDHMTDSDLTYQYENAYDMQERTNLLILWHNTMMALHLDFGNRSNQQMEQWTAELQKIAENKRWCNISPSSITSASDKYKESTKQVHIRLGIRNMELNIYLTRGYEAHPFELQLSITAHDKDFKSFFDKAAWEQQVTFYSMLQSKHPFLQEECRSLIYNPKDSENIINLLSDILDTVDNYIFEQSATYHQQ